VPHDVARDRFGVALKPAQEAAVAAVLGGRDALVILPTGYGKSLCYALPASILHERGEGTTLVVSPLVALMDDQVRALRARGVSAVALHRSLDPDARRDADAALSGGPALVFVSPERLQSTSFVRRLARLPVARIAVDEAHCVAEWGHDFRPEYGQLGALRDALPAPLIALTATAPPRVADEITRSLRLRDPVRVSAPLRRSNLAYSVELCDGDRARAARVVELCERAGGRAIVYVATRKRAQDVAKALTAARIPAAYYHAGRTAGAREQAVAQFEDGRRTVIVATTAFGMGVDRPDVRLVAHAEAPGTIEAYVQQAGRAGRDGAPARCVLLYAAKDALTHQRLRGPAPRPAEVASFEALVAYATGTECRSIALERALGQSGAPCGNCDACLAPEATRDAAHAFLTRRRAARAAALDRRATDAAVSLSDAQLDAVVAFVDQLKKPVGKRLIAMGLRGSRAKAAKRRGVPQNPHNGALAGVPEDAIVRALDGLLASGRLARAGKKYPTVWIPKKPIRGPSDPTRPRRRAVADPLEAALRDYRTRAAKKRRWKPYQVFPDATLRAMVASRPRTADALLAVPGMGPVRLERFGADLLRILADGAP
jgi:ATP-dependent DNA helicase RecQ